MAISSSQPPETESINPPPLSPSLLAAVTQVVERHDWQLLPAAALARAVEKRLASSADAAADSASAPVFTEEDVTKMATNLYCERWHAACADPQLRHRAYTELAHYLYDRARAKYRDAEMAHEITHDAIILVYEQLDKCQNPGAFMAFALLKLWNAATTYFRRRDRQQTRTTALITEVDEELGRAPMDQSTPLPDTQILDQEEATSLLTRINELVQQSPRASKQFQSVLYKFFYGYSDDEIAEVLETDVANVHVLRSRGLKRLRGDPVLQELAGELG